MDDRDRGRPGFVEDIADESSGVRDVQNRLRLSPRAAGPDSVGPFQSGSASVLNR